MRLNFNTKVNFKFDYKFVRQMSLSEEVSLAEFTDEVIEQFSSDCLNSVDFCNTIKSEIDYLLESVVGGTCCDYIIKYMEVSCRTNKTTIILNGSVNFEFEEESELSNSSFSVETDLTNNFKKYIENEIVTYGEIVDLDPFYLQLDDNDSVQFTFDYKIDSCESKLSKE